MKCRPKSSAAWLVATPLFPFLVAAWVGGASSRRKGDCSSSKSRTDSRESGSRRTAARRKARSAAKDDIVGTAAAAGSFATLIEAVKAAGLVDTLKGDGPFTVFAPVDDAFARLPEGALAELLEDKERLTEVLTLHVVPGRVPASALNSYAAIKTLGGGTLDVATDLGVKVGSAYVIQADVEATNGIVHAIDSVLLPE